MSSYADYKSCSIADLARHVAEVLVNTDNKTMLTPTVSYTQQDSRFEDIPTATFNIPYVNSARCVITEEYQNTLEKINAVLAPLINDMRTQGLVFSQPVGVPEKAWTSSNRYGGVLTFTVGPNPESYRKSLAEISVLDDVLGEGAATAGVLTIRYVEKDKNPSATVEADNHSL